MNFLSISFRQKSYETKQYKKGLKAADAILKKFSEHGGTVEVFILSNCNSITWLYSAHSFNVHHKRSKYCLLFFIDVINIDIFFVLV